MPGPGRYAHVNEFDRSNAPKYSMRIRVQEKIPIRPGPGDFDWVSSFDKPMMGGLMHSVTEPYFDVDTRSKSLFGDKYRDL